MKKTLKKISKIVFAGALVGILIVTVDWQEVFLYVKGADVFYLTLFVIFYFLGILISARKWQVLGKFVDFFQSYFFYLKTYLLGAFLNNFFPSFVGGDTYRAVALGRDDKRMKESSATVVIDRITGFLAIIFLAPLFGFANYEQLQNSSLILLFIGGLFVIFVCCVIGVAFFKKKFIQKSISFAPKFMQKYIGVLAKFHSRDIAFCSFSYSILFSLIGIAVANYMLFLALDVEISVIDYMSVIFLTNLITSIPISIGNIGTKEWAYIFLFGFFGVSGSALVAIVLISRVLQMLISMFALPLYLHEKDRLS